MNLEGAANGLPLRLFCGQMVPSAGHEIRCATKQEMEGMEPSVGRNLQTWGLSGGQSLCTTQGNVPHSKLYLHLVLFLAAFVLWCVKISLISYPPNLLRVSAPLPLFHHLSSIPMSIRGIFTPQPHEMCTCERSSAVVSLCNFDESCDSV